MVVGDLVVGVVPQRLAPLQVGVDGAALDRPGAHERDLDGQIVQRSRGACAAASASAPATRSGRCRPCRRPGSRRRPRGRRAGCARGRSSRRVCRAIWSTHSSTALSMPSPSRSILRKPASAHESLSHWQIWRPSMAAGTSGTSSSSGPVETTIPPECCERWRGSPAISAERNASARKRRSWARSAHAGQARHLVADGLRRCGRRRRAPGGRGRAAGSPSTLPSSRIAPRER